MKKIDYGIITLYGNNNYGNKLQNYALQEILKKYNYTVVTLVKDSLILKMKKIFKILLSIFFKKYRISKVESKRLKKFKDFSNKYLSLRLYNKLKFDEIENYIIGSDQIWSPIAFRDIPISRCLFDKNKKKFSYAASLGVDSVDRDYKNIGIETFSISNMKYISVREEVGKKIIQDITKRKDVVSVLDPTMLLSGREWEKIMIKPSSIEENTKFILNYFLGTINEKRKQEIDRIAKENNCKVINICNKKDPFYSCGPEEFLWLEKHAFLICTDSFHSSVFGIIFNTPFIVFQREDSLNNMQNMNSRLENLLNKFKLNDVYCKDKICNSLTEYEFEQINDILKKEIKNSKEFLEKALRN